MSADSEEKREQEGHPSTRRTPDTPDGVADNRARQDERRHVHPAQQSKHEGGY